MPALVPPTVSVQGSFLQAVDELAAEEEADRWAGTEVFPGETWLQELLGTPEGFEAYVERLRQKQREDCPGRPADYVPDTVLWYVDGSTYLGRLSIRHWLTDFLLNVGRHIGYVVRPLTTT